MAEVDNLWDVNQVEEYLKVPVATLYGWRVKNYGPPADRVGRHLRYDRQDVINWYKNLRQQHSTSADRADQTS
ncbi:helix-turn-helix domain-containing protein [Kribbella sp. NPDC023855]|uniref:helix-turn-helix transcriptional regulator n=1 Tax=Kribbella sp. NPDC023855 TaxID=3154698 RepID=UPI00340879D7